MDGYLKSQRLVHLIPISTDATTAGKREGRKEVAYDEERWFSVIAGLAAQQRQVARATYLRVNDGRRDRLQLVDTGAIPETD